MGMTLEEIKGLNAYELSSMADCADPDTRESPGALMLWSIRNSVIEAIEGGFITLTDINDSGQLHEIADNAPSVYTHEKWEQFLDLCAYEEEPDDGEWPTDLDKAASRALYQIASRLAHTLAGEWRDGWECPTCGEPPNRNSPMLSCDPDTCVNGEREEEEEEEGGTPAEAILTGPVDLPVSDPILDLITAGERQSPGDETSRFMANMAKVNELEFASQRRRRWARWVFFGLALAGLIIAYVVI